MFTAHNVITSCGKYLDRLDHAECTPLVWESAQDLAERISALMSNFHTFKHVTITSGFRTAQANRETNGAKFSAHMQGKAADLLDPDGSLAKAIQSNPAFLVRYDLFMEDPKHTKGWVHLQSKPPKSGNRVFLP